MIRKGISITFYFDSVEDSQYKAFRYYAKEHQIGITISKWIYIKYWGLSTWKVSKKYGVSLRELREWFRSK